VGGGVRAGSLKRERKIVRSGGGGGGTPFIQSITLADFEYTHRTVIFF
jgi:hypothetical protein